MESGMNRLASGRRGWLLRLAKRSQSNSNPRRQETAAWQESRQTFDLGGFEDRGAPAGIGGLVGMSAPSRGPGGDPLPAQFAEAFYLMVMASEMRDRAKALGRRYGLEAMEMRAEIVRYLEQAFGEFGTHRRAEAAWEPAQPNLMG